MEISRITITLRDLIEGYEDKGLDGVVAYGGKLDVRPPYQREYVYDVKERDEVIRTVQKGFPLNVMYWFKTGEDQYELMDGQQRTISICRYMAEGQRTFSVDYRYFFNIEHTDPDLAEEMLKYPLDIYICEGTPAEVLDWFRVINIAGTKLTAQELRNTSFTGPWLADAKRHFSKPTCAAYRMGKDYMSGRPIRQEYLERTIKWIAAHDGLDSIEAYMALHQMDDNANAIWIYYQKVIHWVELIFPVYRSEMKGLEWGLLYNEFKDADLDPTALEIRVADLMEDPEIRNKKGIYTFVLNGDERNLTLRQFDDRQKREIFERDDGKCKKCGKELTDYKDGEADHITPWSKGGKTEVSNGQLLCRTCNRTKSDK